ncbi:GNAT family N-acetyltransferase [Tissierella carlieri]|uniref:GNAT family N-acetyltransferase n=1 Tax=Tissierella carlieri TaxID=689904 RepID=A0ABT1SF74_9FIRM|nr:GNAT family N-acetyltransferase [Tissierella carlieri]MCQ4924602.1 GNAT family N-acetyltransferase [Tissierella carlieri]
MKEIRRLSSEKDFTDFTDIVGNAYPGFNIETREQKKKFVENSMRVQEENPLVTFYGVFEEDNLLGGMRYHDFKMNLLSTKIKVGGVGLIGVDLLNKKEKVAKAIMTKFIEDYRSQGISMAILYPFNPEFYKKMGFGFGTSISQYRVKPSNLPKGKSKSNIKHIRGDDAKKLLDCYTRIYEKTNGLIEKYEREFQLLFNNPKMKVVGYKKNNEIKGYMVFEFKPSHDKNIFVNDIIVNQLLFEDQESLMELMTFLNSQSDQINNVIFNIQDENFRFILEDPRNGSNNLLTPVYHEASIQGTGIMYRIIDLKGIINELRNHNFNNESCKLKITTRDSFITDNDGSIIVDFNNGFPTVVDDKEYDVEIKLDIADFSSLITCTVNFNSLYKYGRALISDESYLKKVNNIFASDEKPICITMF